MEELQLRLLKKQLTTKLFLFWGKKAIFSQKMAAPSKNRYSPKYVYWYQCFSVWKMVSVKSSAGPTLSPFHRLTLLVDVSPKGRTSNYLYLFWLIHLINGLWEIMSKTKLLWSYLFPTFMIYCIFYGWYIDIINFIFILNIIFTSMKFSHLMKQLNHSMWI